MSEASSPQRRQYQCKTKASLRSMAMIDSAARLAATSLSCRVAEATSILGQVAKNTREFSAVYCETAESLETAADEAVAAAEALIAGCQSLDHEMQSAEVIARTVKGIRRSLDTLETELDALIAQNVRASDQKK